MIASVKNKNKNMNGRTDRLSQTTQLDHCYISDRFDLSQNSFPLLYT